MKTAITVGAATYLASRFIWDARQPVAIAWGVALAAVGYYIANQKPISIQNKVTTDALTLAAKPINIRQR